MYRLTGVRPTAARTCLGWEWVMEAWLRTEAEGGELAPELVRAEAEAPQQRPMVAPPRHAPRRTHTQAKPAV